MIDIRGDLLILIKDILKKRVPEIEVWAFGSRVNYTAKDSSDLDIVLVSEDSVPFSLYSQLKTDFSESDLPIIIDIVNWTDIDKDFRSVIKQKYVILQKP